AVPDPTRRERTRRPRTLARHIRDSDAPGTRASGFLSRLPGQPVAQLHEQDVVGLGAPDATEIPAEVEVPGMAEVLAAAGPDGVERRAWLEFPAQDRVQAQGLHVEVRLRQPEWTGRAVAVRKIGRAHV